MYEIPKIAVSVELLLTDNETISGNMFVTEDLVSAGGNPQVADLLNEGEDQFFPFESTAGAYRLINKAQVIYIRTEQTDTEVKAQTPIRPKNLVAHFTDNRTIYGVVYPTLAEESRVSDLVNETEMFISIYQNDKEVIVNKTHIIYVNAN